MLNTRPITKKMKDFSRTKDLLYTAFSRSEQAPMFLLLFNVKNYKNFDFEAYYDDETFIGFTYTVTVGNVTYLFYLATKADVRGKGYGSQILSHIRATYPNQRLVLNCFAEDENAEDNEMRKRRRNFYFRNGYNRASFSSKINGNHLEVLTHNCSVTPEEYLGIFKKFFGSILFTFFKPKIKPEIKH